MLLVAGAGPVLAVHLNDDIAPVAARAFLGFATILAMELHALLSEHALSHRVGIEALHELVAEFPFNFDDL
jgi:hypothetical protein